MKKTKNTISLLVSVVFLSGCSLVSTGSDGGVFRSDDGGKRFVQKATVDEKTTIGNVDVLSLAVNPQNGNEIFIGTKSSGIFKSVDAAEKWQQLKVSDSTPTKAYAVGIDPFETKNIYVATIVDGRGKIVKSSDSGLTWRDAYSEPSEGPFVLSLAIDPKNPTKIFAGNNKGQIMLSENGGDTWKNIFDAGAEVFKIAIDSANPENVYFAVYQKGLLRSEDGGKNFESTEERGFLGNQQLGNVSSLAVDPKNGWVYAGTDTGLFRSRNAGEEWELVKVLNRPQENAIRGIAVNPGNSNEIIYGASQAFYKSIDGGQSWATVQLRGSRTIEAVAYNLQNPAVIYSGMNKR